MSFFKIALERINGNIVSTDKKAIQHMNRRELVEHLESRGFACYDDESTKLLRETALEDLENG